MNAKGVRDWGSGQSRPLPRLPLPNAQQQRVKLFPWRGMMLMWYAMHTHRNSTARRGGAGREEKGRPMQACGTTQACRRSDRLWKGGGCPDMGCARRDEGGESEKIDVF